MIQKSIAIINNAALFDATAAKDALDLALIFGSYEQEVSLFFIGEGVRQLISGQQPEAIGAKDILKTFAAFEFYDIENIYVCRQSLADRNLAEKFHIDNVQVLSPEALREQLADHQVTLRF